MPIELTDLEKILTNSIDSYYEYLRKFTNFKYNDYKFPEYFLTSTIAVNLYNNWIDKKNLPMKICLEEATRNFAYNCFPFMDTRENAVDKLFGETIFSKPKETSRKGKIDICIYEKSDFGDKSVCCIEVKDNKPNNNDLSNDLFRMSELFKFTDQTGANSLELAFLPFTYDITNHWYSEKRIKNIISNKKDLAKKYCSDKVSWNFTILKDDSYSAKNPPTDEDYREHSYRFLYCCFIGIRK